MESANGFTLNELCLPAGSTPNLPTCVRLIRNQAATKFAILLHTYSNDITGGDYFPYDQFFYNSVLTVVNEAEKKANTSTYEEISRLYSQRHLLKVSLFLDSIKAKLFEIYLELRLTKEELSVEKIKNIYLGKGPKDYTILGVIDEAVELYEKELSPGSLKNYRATKSYVGAFCKTKYKSGDIKLKYLTYTFISQLKSFILHHPLKTHDPCTNNGCMKHLERIKKIITWAHEMRYIDRNVFGSFKIKKNPFEEGRRLTWEQFKDLEKRSFDGDMLNLVKDIFIFCCYTGMAPIDVQRLEPHQIFIGADGLIWLTYLRAKSKVSAYVPLLSPAVALIEKHRLRKGAISGYCFPICQ